jgi:hypothetical protein
VKNSFGQNVLVFRVFSTNVTSIRTRLPCIWSFLSECGRYSDTITQYLEFSGRMWPLFEHDYLLFRVFWPNVASIRTRLPCFRVFWPNVAAIRTRLPFIWSFLSECGLYSDTITLFLEFSGRMWPLFGHDQPVFRVFWPNVASIRTRLPCF